MQAWQVFEFGEPSKVLELRGSVELPKPTGEEVLLDVEACALNFADGLLCRGTYQERPPFPFTPGLELSGVVAASGPEAHHGIGTRVLGAALLPHGGFAERCLARSHDVFPIPDSVPSPEAAGFHITYQTAWFGLLRRAHLRPGETLLVHAGAGGTGSAAIQLGRAMGARVFATASGEDKLELCREHGAELAIDYELDDFVGMVNDETDGHGADVIFDPVGGETFRRSTKCIAWEGRIVVIGAAGGNYAEARTNHALVKNYSVHGLNWGGYRSRHPDLVAEAHDDLMGMWRNGSIRPLVSVVGGLEALPGALEKLNGRKSSGKLVMAIR